jgi:hypothetical protein
MRVSISLRKSLIEEIFLSMALAPQGLTAGWFNKLYSDLKMVSAGCLRNLRQGFNKVDFVVK